jgi:hypothetical protein
MSDNWKPAIHALDHSPIGPDAIVDLRQFYVEPISPADEPDDYLAGDSLYSSFSGAWANISADYPPTGYSLAVGGKLRFQIYATGDETTDGSLMFTLPAPFRPVVVRRLVVVCGTAAEGIGAVDVQPDGSVVFVHQITSF